MTDAPTRTEVLDADFAAAEAFLLDDSDRHDEVEVAAPAAHPSLMVAREQLDLIRTTLNPDLTEGELVLFAQVANRVGLDPFARQIYATKRGGKMVIQTGIDGYRLIARRTGEMGGRLGPYFAANDGKGWRIGPDAKPLPWLESTPPAAAMVGVIRRGDTEVTWGIATWAEYAITGTGDAMWRKMPSTMLAKCAEAQAIRATFPAETSGVYTEEEMAQAGPPTSGPVAPRAAGEATERLDPWEARPRDVMEELRRRGIDATGAVPALRQRLADAMLGDVIDVTPPAAQEAQDAPAGDDDHNATAPPAAQETPQEAPEDAETCASPGCAADLAATGSVTDGAGVAWCPDHQPFGE